MVGKIAHPGQLVDANGLQGQRLMMSQYLLLMRSVGHRCSNRPEGE